MKRRNFVLKTVLGIPTLMYLPLLPSCEEKSSPIATEKKIIIIGAGISGLAAAKYFKDRGIEAIVIEGQEKVGGRLRTDNSLGIAFDEGASWIHGPDGNPITPLANSAGANTFLTDDNKLAVFDIDGSEYMDNILDEAEGQYEKALASLDGEVNESFQEVFYDEYPHYQNNRLWTFMLSAFLEFDTGGDISMLSSLDFYDDEAFNGKDLIITNGFDKIAQFLAEGIDVRLNTKVSGIDYEGEKIQLTTNQDNFEADFVLLTVPLGVLKNNAISFIPVLPNRIQKSIDKIKMGSVNKFLCIWDTPFWDTDLQYIGYTAETKGKFNYFMNVSKFADVNALMSFTFGAYSKLTEEMTDAEVIDEIMNHLKTIYGNSIPNPTNMLRTKWNTNKFSFGAYSYATNGTRSSDFEAFEESIDNKLFFAGEHTNRDYRGTVHGAYLSGIREAEKIVELL
jgi:monoamine oxidase